MSLRVGSDRSSVLLRTKQSQTHSVTSQNTWTFRRTAVITPDLSRLNRYYVNHWRSKLFLTWRIGKIYKTSIKVAGIKIYDIEITHGNSNGTNAKDETKAIRWKDGGSSQVVFFRRSIFSRPVHLFATATHTHTHTTVPDSKVLLSPHSLHKQTKKTTQNHQ